MAQTRSSRVSYRLGARTRKGFLVLHIGAAGAWLGIDVVLAILVFTGMLTDDLRIAATCYQALAVFAIWPLLAVGVVCLISGVVLALGSKYGLVKYWWVVVKLALNIVLSALVLVALRPTIDAATVYGQQLAAGHAVGAAPSDLLFPPTVSPTCLAIAIVLSVFKPWGLIRKRKLP
jgi:hypothetical protein